MKRILIFLLASLPFVSGAQSFSSIIAGFRTYNNTTITSKTTSHSITPTNVGGNIDSLASLVGSAFDSINTAGNLQGVTNAGNTTTNSIILGSVTTGYATEIDSQEVQSGSPIIAGAGNVLSLRPTQLVYKQLSGASIKQGALLCEPLSASANYYMPNENFSAIADSRVLLHHTANPIFIGSAGTIASPTTGVYIDATPQITLNHGGTIYGRFKWNGTQAALSLADAASPNTADIIAGTLSSARVDTLPDYSGNFYMNYGGHNSQALVSASTMTIPFTCPFVPSRVMVTPKDAGAGAAWAGSYVSAITGAHFVITFPTPLTATCTFDYQLFP